MGGQTAAWLEVKIKRELYEPCKQIQGYKFSHLLSCMFHAHKHTENYKHCRGGRKLGVDEMMSESGECDTERERESNYLRSMPITGNWLSGTMSFIGRHKLLSRGRDGEK